MKLRIRDCLAIIAFCVSSLVASTAQADISAERLISPSTNQGLAFEARKYPFLPHLIASENPKLCNAFRDALKTDFLGSNRNKRELTIPGGDWLIDFGDQVAERVSMEVKFGNDKNMYFIIDFGSMGRGQVFNLYISDDDDYDILNERMRAGNNDKLKDKKDYIFVPVSGASGIFPENPIHILSYDGSYYLYVDWAQRGWSKNENEDILSQIHADGTTEKTCVIRREATIVAADDQPHPLLDDVVIAPRKFTELQNRITELWGERDRLLFPIQYLALVAPWKLVHLAPPYEPTVGMTLYHLRRAGLSDLPSHRAYPRFEAFLPEVVPDLASYYQANFGLDQGASNEAAKIAVGVVVAESFSFDATSDYPSVLDDPSAKFEDRFTDASVRNRINDFLAGRFPARAGVGGGANELEVLFQAALLVGTPPSDLERLVKAGAHVSDPLNALEHPAEVAFLLDRGADVDSKNEFDKTALMYAAHYDLLETVDLLLRHGADVNAKTDSSRLVNAYGGSAPLDYDGRTALMYAAENASAAVIGRLLEAGAVTDAVDTGGRSLRDYLSLNTRVDESDRSRLMQRFANSPP